MRALRAVAVAGVTLAMLPLLVAALVVSVSTAAIKAIVDDG